MKFGNISKSVINAPEFFKNQMRKKMMDTFIVPPERARKKIYRARDFLDYDTMNNLNFNHNRRHYYIPKRQEEIIQFTFFPEMVLSSSRNLGNLSEKDREIAKLEEYKEKNNLNHLSTERFHNTMQEKTDYLINRINDNTQTKKFETSRTQSTSQTQKFPLRTTTSKASNNRYSINTNEDYRLTLRHKVQSLQLISPKTKKEIRNRTSNMYSYEEFEKMTDPKLSFKEIVERFKSQFK